MVWQTARLLGMAPSGTAELTDAGSIASWALDAAQWAVSAGGLDTQNGAFHPQDTLTRAEGGGPSLSSPLTPALLCHPCLSQSSTASPACAWKEASSRSSSSSRSPARYQT